MIKASEETEHFTFLEIFKSLPAFFLFYAIILIP